MTAEQYRAMISSFVGGHMPADRFEREFLEAFLDEPADMDDELFRILDELFGAVDAYWPECGPGEETAFVISEDTLRHQAEGALERLNRYLDRNPVGRTTV
jgi:hypothetical protein